METLSDDALRLALEPLPEWSLQAGRLLWQGRFASFAAAFAFLTQVALLAERRDHHPAIALEYDTLELRLVSHDAGDATRRDLELAAAITALPRG